MSIFIAQQQQQQRQRVYKQSTYIYTYAQYAPLYSYVKMYACIVYGCYLTERYNVRYVTTA